MLAPRTEHGGVYERVRIPIRRPRSLELCACLEGQRGDRIGSDTRLIWMRCDGVASQRYLGGERRPVAPHATAFVVVVARVDMPRLHARQGATLAC